MTLRSPLSLPRVAGFLLCAMLLVPFVGCGQSSGSGGVKSGGAAVSDEVEAANKAAEAAYAAEKGKKR